ncbi:hypothetical protein [Paraburkholderia sp. CI3]|uniref:hypothetical protein n=1 Tax=Paraburkholderia sp. CI3 TaxID=2991060 RepID=UPI003D25F702
MAKDARGRTALRAACARSNYGFMVHVVKVLLERGAKSGANEKGGTRPFNEINVSNMSDPRYAILGHVAQAMYEGSQSIRLEAERLGDLTRAYPPSQRKMLEEDGQEDVGHIAARENDVPKLKTCSPAVLTKQNRYQRDALDLAIQCNHPRAARALMEKFEIFNPAKMTDDEWAARMDRAKYDGSNLFCTSVRAGSGANSAGVNRLRCRAERN